MPVVSPLQPAVQRVLRCAAVLCALAATADAQEVTLTAPGASEDLVERLERNALLMRDPPEGEVRTGQDILAAARADYGRLVGVLYEEGYFAPVINILLDGQEAARISPFASPGQVSQVTIRVQTGQPFRFGTARIGPLTPDTDLPDGFAAGQSATTRILREATDATLTGWREQGHAVADVASQQITARNREAVLDADIRIAPGPVVRFGELIPQGQERMRIARIIEIAGLPTGDIYSPEALRRASERLRDTGVFAAVSLEPRELAPGDVMDITAVVDEAPLRRFGFGFEISSEDGAGISAYWLHRNLFGGAERLRIDGGVAGLGQGGDVDGVDATLSVGFERPATFTPNTKLNFDLELYYLNEPLFDATAILFTASLDHVISPTLEVSGGVGIVQTWIDDALGDRETTLLALPLGLTYDTRDDPLDARSGLYFDTTVTPFFSLGGTGGARFTSDARAYFAFGEAERSRLAARLQLGSLAGADITDIPPDYLFYSGGSGTVRGQDYQSLGAIQNGLQSGGRGFAGLSGEFRQDIGDGNFGLVAFADVGYVTADAFGGGSSDWHAGAGLGVRYDTPFGPIRVDLATPVGGDNPGEDLYLYIGIGQSF